MKSAEQLRSDVEEELAWEPSLDQSGIDVSVDDGAVTLRGHVPTYYQKTHAILTAERVAGVRAVADELEVRLASSHVHDDPDIAEAIARRLASSTILSKTDVKAEVSDGEVTLKGTVSWDFERRAATKLARDVTGVRGVFNLVSLKPTPSAKAVERQIISAFDRQAALDSRNVKVTIHDSTAVLNGHVRSFAEERTARRAAFAAPGISRVESHLTIEP